jgi:hypothetical protein
MRSRELIPPLVIGIALTAAIVIAAPSSRKSADDAATPLVASDTSYISSGRLLMFINNNGSYAYDRTAHFGKNDGLHYPGTCPQTVVYAAGLWLGAKVGGEPRVAAAEYAFDYTPGAIGGLFPGDPHNRVYKIHRGDTRGSNPDYAEWPIDDGAPAVKNSAGVDSIGGDGFRIPLLRGDEATWCVFNDADMASHVSDPGSGSAGPLGVEVQLYAYAYDSTGPIGRTVFMQYTLINKGSNQLDSMFVALWGDPDLGDAGDDLVGCDTTLSLEYCYNSGPDAVYGADPPAVGEAILMGPVVPAPGRVAFIARRHAWVAGYENLPMTAFSKYINGTDPAYNLESFGYMKGLGENGSTVINPVTNQPTNFMVSGDPVSGSGWLDANPADRRYMMTTGPVAMAPGDTQEVAVAMVVGAEHEPSCIVGIFVDTVNAIHTAGPSSGRAFGLIIHPDSTTGHDYRITCAGSDAATSWSLYDLTLGRTVVADNTDFSGDDKYPIADGMMVKVISRRPGVGDWSVPSGTRHFTLSGLSNLPFEGFNGAIGWDDPCHFFGVCDSRSVPLSNLRHVLLKLATTDQHGNFDPDDVNVSYAYRYLGAAETPPAQPEFAPYILNTSANYAYQSFAKSVPLSAWDIDANPPRRLAIGHLENNVMSGAVDGRYWPPNVYGPDNFASTGPREWLWIFDADYAEVPDPSLEVNALTNPLPVMYFSVAARRDGVGFDTGDEFLIIPAMDYLTAADVFEFTAPPPVSLGSPLSSSLGPSTALGSVTDLRRVDSVARAQYQKDVVPCGCPCLADPSCSGISANTVDVLDVVGFIDIAFRGVPAVQDPACPKERTDIDCSGATDVVDVVKAIDVAFRNGDPATHFCRPCL